jgi:demethylmenaquinone methyltransferase/2-methoxy-6-polyprenyl-1,4-benzoquinol methylase
MLAMGRKKIKQLGLDSKIELATGDAETINHPDNSFDAVMVAFGVRNFQHLEKGLSEIRRVLKPGGKLVVLEFSKPRTFGIRHLYGFYMDALTPAIGRIFSKNRSAYQYLNQSIKKFPEGKNFTSILDRLGYSGTNCKPQLFGICSIYCGRK